MSDRGVARIPRLIAIATLACCILAAALVYFAFDPRIDALQGRLDDAQATLRSDDVAFAEMPHVRDERDSLARRYDRLLNENPDALFLRDLDALARRHGVQLAGTTIVHDAAAAPQPFEPRAAGSLFLATRVQLELRGTYRHLLAAIGELSLGSEIVRVDPPTLQRAGDDLDARVPVTIFEPVSAR